MVFSFLEIVLPQMPCIMQVKSAIEKICFDSNEVCRTVVTSDVKCVVYDLHHWDSKMTNALCSLHPFASVLVTHSASSASGFIVIVQIESRIASARTFTILLFAVICFILTQFIPIGWLTSKTEL